MAEENQIPEMIRLMEVVVQKVDGLASDVRTNTYSIDRLENKIDLMEKDLKELRSDFVGLSGQFKELKSDVGTLSGQFNDVGIMAIKDHKIIDDLGQRVDILEQKPH